jgi:hypothetical protein
MLKLSGFDVLFAAAGNLYLLLALAGVCLALWKGETWQIKLLMTVLVLVMFLAPIAPEIYRQVEYRSRLATAKAMFAERCRIAGEKIYKTVENVEGIELVNPRQKRRYGIDEQYQSWSDAGFPGEEGGNAYIMDFLYFNKPQSGNHARELGQTPGGLRGYPYVDVQEGDSRFRYRLRDESQYVNDGDPVKAHGKRELTNEAPPRYAISYENIEDPEGRANWIAGGRVALVDRSNGELLGEFIRYSLETGFGNTSGFRSPWAFAIQCPQTNYGGANGHIRSFVEKVLKPSQGK